VNAQLSPAELVHARGGRYASEFGIDLAAPDPGERFKWFLAALLFGAPISAGVASRTWRAFAERGLLTPGRIVDTGWDGLVAILDAGGYVRYDYKTASKLLEVCGALLRDHGGDLDRLHRAASGPRDLEVRLKALGKGIGDVTVGIFLRELRGVWNQADPPLSPLALDAAIQLGYLPRRSNPDAALARLKTLWRSGAQTPESFADFEAALVREGLRQRREAGRRPKPKPTGAP
jgi:hypothetical protein